MVVAAVLAACASVGVAQDQPGIGGPEEGTGRRGGRGPSMYIRNARVLMSGGEFMDGATIQVTGSTIRQVGKNVEVPDGATVVDADGLTVTPGLIDADATLAVSFAGGAGRGVNPEATNRAFDAFDRYAVSLFKDAVRNGVTTLSISPRGGSGITGLSSVVRLQPGADGPWAGVVVKEDAALCIDLSSAAPPTQRLETFGRVRGQFKAAAEYREAMDTYKEELEEYEKKVKERADKQKAKDGTKDGAKEGAAGAGASGTKAEPPKETPSGGGGATGGATGGAGAGGAAEKKDEELKKPTEPTIDRKSEVLLRAIDRALPVRVRCDRSEDILNAIDLAKEFSLTLIIDGATEGHLVAKEIARAEAAVVLGPALGRGFFVNDAYHRRSASSIDVLRRAGVKCVVGSGRGGVDAGQGDPSASRFVLANAQLVAQQSNEKTDPLKMVTTDAAEFLGVASSVGRVSPGMPADLVLWSGNPLDASSRVREVYIGGELVYRNESTASGGAN